MANMNMIIHDMEGEIQIGDTFRNPKFRQGKGLKTFDRIVANPMWNQTEFKEQDYDADELNRFPKEAGYPGSKADWGWMQHILASLKPNGRAAVVLDTGAASRGSGNANANKENEVRRWFVEQDLIEGVALTAELKMAILHQLFTQGLRHELQKQTEIGSVPQSWEVVPLIEAVDDIDYGISAPIPKTRPANGVKIVSTADITKDGRLLYNKIRYIEAPATTVARLTLRTGDVLFNWRNSAELIGKSAVFQEQPEPHVFASFILRIRCCEKRSHNYYLAHLMNQWRQEEVFLKLARRAVNQANYNKNEISVLKIPLPSYEEQREIADVIRAVDDKLDFHRRKSATLAALFRTLLHQLVTAQIRVRDLDLPEIESAAAA
jgi:N-6 DNA Methylase/Type I restriction modification DNA specificity domain